MAPSSAPAAPSTERREGLRELSIWWLITAPHSSPASQRILGERKLKYLHDRLPRQPSVAQAEWFGDRAGGSARAQMKVAA